MANTAYRRIIVSMVEAVGIEPTSEGLQRPASPCAACSLISPSGRSAGDRITGPVRSISVNASGQRVDPARQAAPIPGRQAEPRERRSRLMRLVRSRYWQLCCPTLITSGWTSTRCRQPDLSPVEPGTPPEFNSRRDCTTPPPPPRGKAQLAPSLAEVHGAHRAA